MWCHSVPRVSSYIFPNNKLRVLLLAAGFAASYCVAPAEEPQSGPPSSQTHPATVTITAGTRLELVLTQPIQSRRVRRGDDIYAQVVSPVHVGNETVIPPGTFVQGTLDKIERHGAHAELRLQSMNVTFPDGYTTPVAGPITLTTDEGYTVRDIGQGRLIGGIAAPAAGAGLGAVIGHSITPSASTLTTTSPPGCIGPQPACLSSSMTVPGNAGRNTVIGAGVGAGIGAAVSLVLLFGSHHFYVDVGAPVEMKFQREVTLSEVEAENAVLAGQQHPVPQQPIAHRPVPKYPPMDTDNPPTQNPGSPPIIIPGAPGPDGVPGAPTVIPGSPPST